MLAGSLISTAHDRIDVNIPDYRMPHAHRGSRHGWGGETLPLPPPARSIPPVLINEYGEYYTESTAVQFDYWGRTYLTIGFGGGGMLAPFLIDITGVTGAISTSNFIWKTTTAVPSSRHMGD